MNKRVIASWVGGLVGAMLLAVPAMAQNIVTGGPAEAQVAAKNASNKPFTAFRGIGSGTATLSASHCPDVACTGTDTCACVQWSGVAFNGNGVGKGSISGELSLDLNSNVFNGSPNGSCDSSSGIATITAANGSTISVVLAGNSCETSGVMAFDGSYTLNGGTGKQSNAAGTGAFDLSTDSINAGSADMALTMYGANK